MQTCLLTVTIVLGPDCSIFHQDNIALAPLQYQQHGRPHKQTCQPRNMNVCIDTALPAMNFKTNVCINADLSTRHCNIDKYMTTYLPIMRYKPLHRYRPVNHALKYKCPHRYKPLNHALQCNSSPRTQACQAGNEFGGMTYLAMLLASVLTPEVLSDPKAWGSAWLDPPANRHRNILQQWGQHTG